ncbi:MAG: hypothetical protein KF774_11565 [Planctomyces sp.]|nr:hypothetical protein [Planctomyces sp.]
MRFDSLAVRVASSIPLSVAAALALPGCSRESTPPAASSQATSADPQPGATEPASQAAAPPPVDPARPETKWIGTIPYDVFFDQPLRVAANAAPVAGGIAPLTADVAPGPDAAVPPVTSVAPPIEPSAPVDAAPEDGDGAVDWGQIAAMAVIVDEVKQARVRLEKNLQKVADFNKNVAAIARDGAVLAALSWIAAEHPEDVNWKSKAGSLRDLSYEIYMKAEGSGSRPFNATKTPFETLKGLLDGESPASEAPTGVTLAEVADRGALMARVDESYNSLKANVNTPARLKEESARAVHELAVMSLLMQAMGDESYDRADDPRYGEFIKRMVSQQQQASAAAEGDRFEDFSSLLSQMNLTCNECHQMFRTGSE